MQRSNSNCVCKRHLFVVHIGEVHRVHLHDLVSHLDVGDETQMQLQQLYEHQTDVLVVQSPHLESNFCSQGARLHVTDVDARFLCRTAGDADAHPLGTHKTEENLLLLDLLPSNGRQACNTAFFLLRRTNQSQTQIYYNHVAQ